MAYDKLSFLSGVAAGRNMESWPAFDTEENPPFMFIIKMPYYDRTIGEDVYIYRTGLLVFQDGGLIDWGDGNYTEVAPSSQSHSQSHTYQDEDSYVVRIWGMTAGWLGTGYFTTNIKLAYTHILTVLPKLSDFTPYRMFENWNNLEYLPDFLFEKQDSGVRDIREMCAGTHIQKIPDGIFSGITLSGYIDEAFYNCRIREIPHNLFNGQSGITSVYNLFGNSSLRSIPDDLFSPCPDITNFTSCFAGCSSVEGRVPPLWERYQNVYSEDCFAGLNPRLVENYADIPEEWK